LLAFAAGSLIPPLVVLPSVAGFLFAPYLALAETFV
jgi:hypothetical protein